MKKNWIFGVAVCGILSVSDSAYGQSIKDILNSAAVKDAVTTVTGGKKLTVENLAGTWTYVNPAIQLEGERFDLDERIAAEFFKLSTPQPKNISKKRMEEYRDKYDRGELDIPLSLPGKRKREESEADNETDYSTIGEYTKALSNMTLDELALDRF